MSSEFPPFLKGGLEFGHFTYVFKLYLYRPTHKWYPPLFS